MFDPGIKINYDTLDVGRILAHLDTLFRNEATFEALFLLVHRADLLENFLDLLYILEWGHSMPW